MAIVILSTQLFCFYIVLLFSVCCYGRSLFDLLLEYGSFVLNLAPVITRCAMMELIRDLLKGEKVEWKPLGEVCDTFRGVTYSKKDVSDSGGYSILRANNITLATNTVNFDEIVRINNSSNVKKEQKLYKNDLLISIASGSREHVGKVAFIADDLDYYYGGFMSVIRCKSTVNPRFLFHILTGALFSEYLDKELKTSTINNINSRMLNNFQIPIPPLHVQERIVEILDAFTELTEEIKKELASELTAREKQYAYYRDKLLSPSDFEARGIKYEWKTLGEVAEVQRGASPRPINKYISDTLDDIPWIKIGDVNPNDKYILRTKQRITKEGGEKSRILKRGDLILSNSLSYGRPYILGIEGAIHDGWASISNYQKKLNTEFLYYYLSSSMVQDYWNSRICNSTIKNLNSDIIKSLEIPIPPIEEQERIVKILDKFNTLANSISEGLPREIALRQKQYEYYRESLLSFN